MKNEISKIKIAAMYQGTLFCVFFYFLLFVLPETNSDKFYFSILKDYMHLSYNQLIPIAAETQAAGAKTSNNRIITEAK